MAALPLIGLAGGLLGGLLGSGSKVKVPTYRGLNPTTEQSAAIAGNIKSFKDASKLSSMTNEFNQNELEARLRQAIPNYDKLIRKGSDLISSGLSGEIPTDVASAVARNAAEKATAGGYDGSGMARNLTARDLGRTSYDIQQQALDNALKFTSTLRSTSVAGSMGPEAMFVTPAQRIAAIAANNGAQFNAELMAAQAKAAPNPLLANLGGFISQVGGMAYSAGQSGQTVGGWLGTSRSNSWTGYAGDAGGGSSWNGMNGSFFNR